jgi:hypothetical protein
MKFSYEMMLSGRIQQGIPPLKKSFFLLIRHYLGVKFMVSYGMDNASKQKMKKKCE